jgi:AcrR family transcriptional regulator
LYVYSKNSILLGMDERMKRKDSGRLSREQWLALALDVLARDGEAKLRIDRLAQDLGVTKGSFYWHFKDRDDFVTSLTDYWVKYTNKRVIDMVSQAKEGAKERLAALVEAVFSEKVGRYDLVMRVWAAREPEVARVVKKVDEERFEFVRSLFSEMGFRGRELENRTRLFVCYMAGEHVTFVKESREKQREEMKVRLAFFTRP